MALFAIATSVVLFPTISKHIRNDRSKDAIKIFAKSFYALLFLLSFATVTGIVFAKEIIWLLFERGAFTQIDTLNSANVLVMYMIGLVPFGLAKLFSLWLYAHRRQKTSAKISAISLGFNIILSLLLIKPLGAGGLALASSISGVVLLILTLKEFGGFQIFKTKYLISYLLILAFYTILNLKIHNFLF
jgi:putative peptidoglycan lipid II flippase